MLNRNGLRGSGADVLSKFSTTVSFLGAGAVLCSALLLSGCGDRAGSSNAQGTANGVIGGTEVFADEPISKVVVGLVVQTVEGEGLCSGTLLDQDLVLTAAHCIHDDMFSGQVQFGPKLGGKAITRPITAMVRHEKYEPNMAKPGNHFDIALVRFSGGPPAGFVTAAIDANPATVKSGMKVSFAGYGLDSHVFNSGAGQLRQTMLTVAVLPNPGEIMVGSSWGNAICNGDSGGGLLIEDQGKYVVVGVTSRTASILGVKCIAIGTFTSVPFNADWILKTAEAMRASPTVPPNAVCFEKMAASAQVALAKDANIGRDVSVFGDVKATDAPTIYSMKFWNRKGCEGHLGITIGVGNDGDCEVEKAFVSPKISCQ